MKGLLDFISTPEGQGLLAAGFGGLAGARRGQPINSLGRAGLAGLAGYSGAQDRIDRQDENAVQKQFRDMQLTQMRTQMDQQKSEQDWYAGLPGVMQPKPVELDQFTGATQMQPPDPKAVQNYMTQRGSPIAKDLLKQQFLPAAADYLTVDSTVLKKGPNGLTPVYTAPPKPEGKPTKVQEYEYAKANGYKGSLQDYVSIGPSITAGALAGLRNAQIDNIQRENDYNLPPPVAAPRPRPAPAGGGVSVTAGGKTYTFPTAAAANQFKAQAGIK